jgi:uncharacterized membrane protein (DUF485 family)
MNEPQRPSEGRAGGPATGGAGGVATQPEIDWIAAERSPEFKDLVKKKKAFVLPATIFFLSWYFGFVLLAGYAPDFMGREFITDGITVGYALALTQFVMTWVLGWLYLRKSDRVFDPLARRAADKALEVGRSRDSESHRFDRTVGADGGTLR